MPAARRSWLLILFWRLHRWIFQISDGRIGSSLLGHKVLQLTTKGHKTGEPRKIMIYYFLHQGSYVIVGSNVGSDRHPAWYLNLQADPVAEIQIGRERKKVVARTAKGEDRERLWSEIVEKDPNYAEYQSRTDRQIPVVILDPLERRESSNDRVENPEE